jgi:hypothetical protein
MLPVVFALSLLPLSPCADLSGRYVLQGADNRVYVSIAQTQCARIVVTWETSWEKSHRAPVEHHLVLDGRFHPDTRWFGGQPQQTSASLKGATLEIEMKQGDAANVFMTLRLTLLADGDLCVADSTGGSQLPSRASRQRAPGRAEEDDAAHRTGAVCSVQ